MAKLTTEQVLMARHLRELGLRPEFEYRFHADRKWRFDLAVPSAPNLGIEIEGGVWTRGRHTRGAGYIADLEKYNTATMLGWRILRFTPQQVNNGEAKSWLSQWISSCKR